jgi:hypothetical protein
MLSALSRTMPSGVPLDLISASSFTGSVSIAFSLGHTAPSIYMSCHEGKDDADEGDILRRLVERLDAMA